LPVVDEAPVEKIEKPVLKPASAMPAPAANKVKLLGKTEKAVPPVKTAKKRTEKATEKKPAEKKAAEKKSKPKSAGAPKAKKVAKPPARKPRKKSGRSARK